MAAVKVSIPGVHSPPAPITPHKSFIIFLVCLSYGIISIVLVFSNRKLFTEVFKKPIFISWFQQVCGMVMYWTLYLLSKYANLSPFGKISSLPLNKTSIKDFVPVLITFIGMIVCANISLRHALISTYQTSRSLTIFCTLFFSYILLGERFGKLTLFACSLQSSGFLIGSLDIKTLAPMASLFGALSSLCQGLYNVVIKRALVHTGNSPLTLLGVNISFSSIFLIPFIFIFGERDSFLLLPALGSENFFTIWGSLLFSAFFAMLLNLLSFTAINITSPVTFNIIGITKSCLQTIMGLFLGDPLSFKSGTAIFFTISGASIYSYSKIQQANKSIHTKYEPLDTFDDDETNDSDIFSKKSSSGTSSTIDDFKEN